MGFRVDLVYEGLVGLVEENLSSLLSWHLGKAWAISAKQGEGSLVTHVHEICRAENLKIYSFPCFAREAFTIRLFTRKRRKQPRKPLTYLSKRRLRSRRAEPELS